MPLSVHILDYTSFGAAQVPASVVWRDPLRQVLASAGEGAFGVTLKMDVNWLAKHLAEQQQRSVGTADDVRIRLR